MLVFYKWDDYSICHLEHLTIVSMYRRTYPTARRCAHLTNDSATQQLTRFPTQHPSTRAPSHTSTRAPAQCTSDALVLGMSTQALVVGFVHLPLARAAIGLSQILRVSRNGLFQQPRGGLANYLTPEQPASRAPETSDENNFYTMCVYCFCYVFPG